MNFSMFVDDNAHYRDIAYRTGPRQFESTVAAFEEARRIVDQSLEELYEKGMTAPVLFERYKLFGEDPWLVPWAGGPAVPFSGWDYAEERCRIICDGPA